MAIQTRTISQESYPETVRWLEARLTEMDVPKQEILTAELLLEESFFRLADSTGDAASLSGILVLRKRFGDVDLRLSAKGMPYNPIVDMNETTDDEGEMSSLAILKAHREDMSYSWRKGENVVSIRVHKSGSKVTWAMAAALLLGLLFGVLAKAFLDPATLPLIEQNLLHPVRKIIMNALMMLVTPMIFFAIMSGFSGMSDAADIARFGGELVLVSLVKMGVLVAASMAIGIGLGDVPELLPMLQDNAAPTSDYFSVIELLVGIVPENFIAAFFHNNLLQVLFLACFFGVLLAKSGERGVWGRECVTFFHHFLTDALGVVLPFMPLMVAASMMKLAMMTEFSALLGYGKILLVLIGSFPLCLLLSALCVMVGGRLSPFPFLKKLLKFSVIPFSIQSSNACIPHTLKFCSEQLGMDDKLSLFSIPVGIQFNRSGAAIYLACMGILMRSTLGLPMDADFLLSFFVAVFIVALSVPGMPSAEVISLAAVFDLVGIPAEASALFFPVSPIAVIVNVVCNLMGNVASSLLLARLEGKVDETIYIKD
jgi:Na+/H+-dicarboxylate symporter